MNYCPSQSWDRYVADQEAGEFGRWIYAVSKKIAAIDPFWDSGTEILNAIGDDDTVRWASGIKLKVPYDNDLANDDTALIVRTLHAKGRSVEVFPFNARFALYVNIPEFLPNSPDPSPRWIVIPNTESTEAILIPYLAFCVSSEQVYQGEAIS
jgi:hypothetical protein